ncbi:MAG: N-methylhydantoinase B [Gammaproteobacteria bacterium]|jgi:N-methylhydantoinase B
MSHPMSPAPAVSAAFDPIGVEVLKNELTAVAEEMGITMKRTARSLVAKEGADFSTALTDAHGHLIAQGLTIGIHLGYIAGVMPWLLKKFHDDLRPGDIIASNDPYGGVSHFPDVVLIMPIFWEHEIVGFSAIVAHHTDIGGRFPGGMGAACAELYEEGVCIPGVKLFAEGILNDSLVELLAANVRAPDDLVGDLHAQAAACRRGAAGIQRVLEQHTRPVFEAINAQLRDYSERAMRATIATIPDGRYTCRDLFEDDGLGGHGVEIVLALEIHGDAVTVDFAGTGAQVPSAVNVPATLTKACVYVALRSILDTDAPANAGLMAPITVEIPEGCALSPKFPGAVGARGMMMWRVIDMIFLALAQAVPERVYAAGEGGMNLLVYTPDVPDAGSTMLVDIYASGWGARPTLDGIEGVTPMAAGGATRSLPAEMIERECPVILEGFGFVPDTGGAGKYRGALSVYRRWRFLSKGRAMLRNCRVKSVPYGLAEGEDGTPFRAELYGAHEPLSLPAEMMIDRVVQPGESLLHVQPGSGGYGNPFEREPARVLADVRDEKLSLERARSAYGVVLSDDARSVDEQATAAWRAAHAKAD